MKLFLILTLFVYTECANISSDLEPLSDEIIAAIADLKPEWEAGKNFNGSTSIQMDKLVASQKETYFQDFPENKYDPSTFKMWFYASDAWPNCTSISKVYDQRKGYPSWIYAAVGTIADRLCIKTGVLIDVETTVEHLMKSDIGFSNAANSANIGQAFNYWSKNGIFTVKSYNDSNCLPDPVDCKTNGIRLHRYFKVSAAFLKDSNAIMNEIMQNGPVTAYMEVYSDFPSYKSGVYVKSSDRLLGVHNIKLIAWNRRFGTDYYLATNSWSTEWGENGIFKMKREESQFGNVPCAISTSFVSADIESVIPSFSERQLFYLA